MINFTNVETNKINDLIKHTLHNDTLELEVKLINSNMLKYVDFVNIIKKMKSLGFKNISQKESVLNVNFENEPNIRLTIHGDDKINEYCNTNNIKNIKDSIEFIEKKRFSVHGKQVRPLDLRNYDLRVNLKDEKNITLKNKRILNLINKISGMNKYFRYKKIFSFISKDEIFRFDLSLVKSSPQQEIIIDKKKLPKKEVSDNLKRLVIKPKGLKLDFNDWWSSLGETDIVNLRSDNYLENNYYKNLRESETLTNEVSYEFEIEYLGNKEKDLVEGDSVSSKQKFILNKLKENLLILLQSVQKNKFVISNQEKKYVRDDFNNLTGQYRFTDSIPLGITLELENIKQLNNLEYKNSVNIRRKYCVTDKSDGERNLLFIDSKGELFLVNREQEIKKTGVKCIANSNCLIDGELIDRNLNGSKIRKYLAFDLYFSNGNDFRDRILNRSFEEREDNSFDKSRLEELEDLLGSLSLQREESKIDLEIEIKTFRYGDMEEYDSKTQSIIDKYENALLIEKSSSNPNLKLINKLEEDIKDAKQDDKIFTESNKVLVDISSETLDYKTDGLIFTPVKLTVGEGENKKNKYGGRWNRIFKWKPVEENSIDFKVIISKDSNGKEVEKYLTNGDEIELYKKVKLLVGYNEGMNKINGLKVVNENPNYSNSYSLVPFEPTNPFINKLYETYIKIGKNGLVCENGDLIKDGYIVEFSYSKDNKICWNPMRVRDNKTPNAFSTADNVWKTIYKPITFENITTGMNIKSDDDMYYDTDKDKKSIFTGVYKFHNLVKKSLIEMNSKTGDTLLDLSCGELGDLYKWVGNNLSSVLAIDISKNNLINTKKGACSRLLDLQQKNRDDNKENKLLDNIFIVWGDSGKNIRSGMAGLDSLNKFYLDNLFGNVITRQHIHRLGNEKVKKNRGKFENGFDIISCQFSIHYFFKNSNTIKEFLLNVSENLKIGGKLVSTCFDGSKIFKLLENESKIERKDKDEKLLWRIEKNYNDKKLQNNEKCLGLAVDVYVETFYSSFTEYLVNVEYLRLLGEEYGLQISSVKKFDDYYSQYVSSSLIKEPLSKEGKEFSDLNITLVMEKVKEINKTDLKGGGILDAFLSNNTNTVSQELESGDEDNSESDNNEEETSSDNEDNDSDNNDNDNEEENSIKENNEFKVEKLNISDDELGEKMTSKVENTDEESVQESINKEEIKESQVGMGKKDEKVNKEKKGNKEKEKEEENTVENLEDLQWLDDEDQFKTKETSLDITKLSDIELGPDLKEVDIDNIYDANLGFKKRDSVEFQNKFNNNLEEDNQLDINDLNKDLSELNKSVLNIKKETSDGLNLPPLKSNSDVKVIRLDVDKTTANMMNK